MTETLRTRMRVATGGVLISRRFALPLAAGLGVLSSLAFEPVALPYAMVVAVAGLVWLAKRLDAARKRTVALVGFSYGLGFMLPLIFWMKAVSLGAYIGLVPVEAAFYAPLMLAMRAAVRLRAWPLWGAAVWVLGEYVRGSVPFGGFPWGRLAHTSIDTPFSSYARLLGTSGTSAVMFVVAALLLLAVTGPAWRQRGLAALGIVGLTLLAIILPTGIAGADGTRQVALVQGDVPGVFLTWPRGEIFDLHAAETDKLAARIEAGKVPRPDMVLWPENSTDIDPYHDAYVRARIQGLSSRLEAPILVGGIFDGPTVDTSYNAGVVWDANGPGDRYVKRNVVAYGEYVPFRKLLGSVVPRLSRDIPRDMLPGKKPGALTIGDTVVGDAICWDIADDGAIHEAVNAGAQVLVVQTSNASFTGTSQPEQQWDISRLRAIETGRWVLVPSTNGISGVVDPEGNPVQRAPLHQPATLSAKVTLASGTTPAQHLAEPLQYLLLTLGLGAWFLGTRRKKG
ncbi:apolipoprotein N-acyltransferase [Aeromicrobium sp.]|uniref:apolipoprotein N-acyltransferase n=1 Tax=Aeromicrobium sp. TaxID=1871063 RepID=UPI0019C23D00|nr:apolipoprotein N-acyltransferase [Aeromicrobium sp.]MBC7631747.1 apolipoprotein N-acyltransferase [Aeromicrobium sp.]